MSHEDKLKVGFRSPSSHPKRSDIFDKPDKSYLSNRGLPRDSKSQHSSGASIGGPYVMADIAEFVSPIDDSLISSRSQLREHEIKHNVRQAGDFKPGELVARRRAKAEQIRRAANQPGADFKWE